MTDNGRERYDRAEREGRAAWTAGRARDACPYEDALERDGWLAGFEEADEPGTY